MGTDSRAALTPCPQLIYFPEFFVDLCSERVPEFSNLAKKWILDIVAILSRFTSEVLLSPVPGNS